MSQKYGWREVLEPTIKNYINSKNKDLQVIDPFENPTKLARAQGFIEGLQYILNFVDKRK